MKNKNISSVNAIKLEQIATSEEFMSSLNWDLNILEKSKEFLSKWDKREESFYKGRPKYIKDVDLAEREHLRNCVAYWEKKLSK